jgi:hypothetical protein
LYTGGPCIGMVCADRRPLCTDCPCIGMVCVDRWPLYTGGPYIGGHSLCIQVVLVWDGLCIQLGGLYAGGHCIQVGLV